MHSTYINSIGGYLPQTVVTTDTNQTSICYRKTNIILTHSGICGPFPPIRSDKLVSLQLKL